MVICIEEAFVKYGHFDNGLEECSAAFNVSVDEINTCFGLGEGAEGNKLQHQVADYTEALKPAHKYVPWITVDGLHENKKEQALIDDSLGYICKNYKGALKIDACVKHVPVKSV